METNSECCSPFGDVSCSRVDLGEEDFKIVCNVPLQTYRGSITEALWHHAQANPDKPLYVELETDGSQSIATYGEVAGTARLIARSMLEMGATAERPVALLSDNSAKMAQLVLGCYAAGVPVAPVSSAYSQKSSDHAKLKYVLGLLNPSIVVFDDVREHSRAVENLNWEGIQLVSMTAGESGVLGWDELLATGSKSERMLPEIDPDGVAKILFTSGSTGNPKGVINTHRMMCSNQQALRQIWPVLKDKPLQMVDWLPWNHTFGGNQNFNMAIYQGGTLTIDKGRPMPGAIQGTVEAIKATRPSVYFNVPRGFDALLGEMKDDPQLQQALFENVELIGYAGAALPEPIWTALKEIALRVKGREVPIVGLWGSTETGPVVTAVYFENHHAGNIGLPPPGAEIKFIKDAGGKLELRAKAPSVTPGYWGQPELTGDMFDEEGFLKIGDAGKLVDADDVNRGILFDGRIGENFKLLSGTWVNVGELRVDLISTCPELISDVVVAGHNQNDISALIFPKLEACQARSSETDTSLVLTDPLVVNAIRDGLLRHNKSAGGGSRRIARAVLLETPPSVDRSEITDKGYINQRAVLDNRAAIVDQLYGGTGNAPVIDLKVQ